MNPPEGIVGPVVLRARSLVPVPPPSVATRRAPSGSPVALRLALTDDLPLTPWFWHSGYRHLWQGLHPSNPVKRTTGLALSMLGCRSPVLVALLMAIAALAAGLAPRETATQREGRDASPTPGAAGTPTPATVTKDAFDVGGRPDGERGRGRPADDSSPELDSVSSAIARSDRPRVPARFALFARAPGEYPIELVEAERRIGRWRFEAASTACASCPGCERPVPSHHGQVTGFGAPPRPEITCRCRGRGCSDWGRVARARRSRGAHGSD